MSKQRDLIERVVFNPANARKISEAAQVETRLGVMGNLATLAYNGQFVGTGAINSGYMDHSTGLNVMEYSHVDLAGYPNGAWSAFIAGAYTTYTEVNKSNSPTLKQDTMVLNSDVGTFAAYRPFFNYESKLVLNQQYIYSFYVRNVNSSGGDPFKVQFRVVEYPTQADADANTNAVVITTSPQYTFPAGTTNAPARLSLNFTPVTTGIVRFEHHSQRTSGTSGVLAAARLWNFQVEPIQQGQTQPSVFRLPLMDAQDLSVSVLEQNVLSGYMQGLGYAKTVGTADSVAVASGAAYVPGVASIVAYAGGNVSVPGVNNIRYLYLYRDSSGVGQVEISTTAPDDSYIGNAKTKTGDTTRRFIGTVVRYGGTTANFYSQGDWYYYFDSVDNRIVLNSGANNVATNVDISTFVPPHARVVMMQARAIYNTAANTIYISYPGGDGPDPASAGIVSIFVNANSTRDATNFVTRCNAAQVINYAAGAGTQVTLWVTGFQEFNQ